MSGASAEEAPIEAESATATANDENDAAVANIQKALAQLAVAEAVKKEPSHPPNSPESELAPETPALALSSEQATAKAEAEHENALTQLTVTDPPKPPAPAPVPARAPRPDPYADLHEFYLAWGGVEMWHVICKFHTTIAFRQGPIMQTLKHASEKKAAVVMKKIEADAVVAAKKLKLPSHRFFVFGDTHTRILVGVMPSDVAAFKITRNRDELYYEVYGQKVWKEQYKDLDELAKEHAKWGRMEDDVKRLQTELLRQHYQGIS